MSNPTLTSLMQQIDDEWARLHHNASLLHVLHNLPDFTDEEQRTFWDWLDDMTRWAIDDLEREIAEKWGITLHFYQYGRSGATIAPGSWMTGRDYSKHNFDDGLIYEDIGWDNLAAYNLARKVLAILRYVNEYWRAVVKAVPDLYREDRELLAAA